MRFSRSSGILLHPTSLPGRFGIGDLGKQAYAFARLRDSTYGGIESDPFRVA